MRNRGWSGGFPAAEGSEKAQRLESRRSSFIQCFSDEIAFPKSIVARQQVHRIAADVAGATPKVRGVTNDAVEIILLPKRTGRFYRAIDLMCGEPLPTLYDCLQTPAVVQRQQGMHVIRHDDERMLLMPGAVEVQHCGEDNVSSAFLSQGTIAVQRIKPSFYLSRKAVQILALLRAGPWPRIQPKPSLPLVRRRIEKFARNGIGKAKGHEIGRGRLLPMRKTISRLRNLFMRIEKFRIHGGETNKWKLAFSITLSAAGKPPLHERSP